MNAAMHITASQILAIAKQTSQPKPRRVVRLYTSAKPCRKCGSFTRYASNRCCAGCAGAKNGGAKQ